MKTTTRTTIVIEKELYKTAKEKAKKENRSFSNYITYLIKKDTNDL